MADRLNRGAQGEAFVPRPDRHRLQDPRTAEQARLDRALDEALSATFPASDPVQMPYRRRIAESK